MGSSVNTPLLVSGTAINVVSTTEIVAVVSGGVTTNNAQTQVQFEFDLDFLNSSSGTTITLKIRRGNGITGAAVATFGPFALTASLRSNYSMNAVDVPGEVHQAVYSATVTVAGNSGTPVIETATLQALVTPAS